MLPDQGMPDLVLPSPLMTCNHPLLTEKKIKLFVKRDDLIHPEISGNKYRKLKYNLEKIKLSNAETVITFGGAFSNHLHATAATCHYLGIQSVGIVRGEDTSSDNPTLQFCKQKGMVLHFIGRNEYRLKTDSDQVKNIIQLYPHPFILPEGGSNPEALVGVSEIWDELTQQLDQPADYIFCAAGTGATLAGLLKHAPEKTHVLGFSSLKSEHLKDEILRLTGEKTEKPFTFFNNYHFGGYAKTTTELLDFITALEAVSGIPMDYVYNGKAVFGMFDLIQKNFFPENSVIVWLHTGGLQGKKGMPYLKK
jgi:1-aminocyclopropane-1-carboxylate deaminase